MFAYGIMEKNVVFAANTHCKLSATHHGCVTLGSFYAHASASSPVSAHGTLGQCLIRLDHVGYVTSNYLCVSITIHQMDVAEGA